MSTDATLAPVFRAGTPRTLFRAPVFGGGATTTNHYWDMSPDGQRFLINTTSANDDSSMLTVVVNLERRKSAGTRGPLISRASVGHVVRSPPASSTLPTRTTFLTVAAKRTCSSRDALTEQIGPQRPSGRRDASGVEWPATAPRN